MKKIISIIIIIIVVVVLIFKAKELLQNRQSEISNEALPSVASISVALVKPTEGILQNKESYLAQVSSDKSIQLSTKLAGYVKHVLVEESQKVKKGELLVRIDQTELHSSIESLQSTLSAQRNDVALAKSIYTRNIKLFDVGGLAKEQLDISKVAMNTKESLIQNTLQKIKQVQHQLSYLEILAPFDGEIDAVLLHQGDLAASGKPILSMSNGKKKLLFSYATYKTIEKGQPVFASGKKIGEVKSIYTTSQNGLVNAEITLTSTLDAPVGSSINIKVLTKELRGCTLPSDTVVHKKEGTFVMTYVEGKFIAMKINIAMQNENTLLVWPCPNMEVAKASEVKLAQLPAYDKVEITGREHE